MEQFKNKCCNHLGSSTTNSPITNFKPWGLLLPGKDLGNITQSCFALNKLPNIETVKELAFELCNVQQAFDKCPLYYTKSNFDALIDTITKAFFHLYVKLAEVTETPWFEGYAELDLDPVEKAKKENKKFPGFYLIKDIGEYPNFKDINGDILNVYESDLIDHIIFFKPVFDINFKFLGYEKIISLVKGILDIYDIIEIINNNIVSVNDNITNIKLDIVDIDDRVTILEGKAVALQQPILYSELVELINTNSLNPGQEYRITDYTFTTTQEFTSSANHDFDIIVSALNTNTLNENAKAACKENDEYFKNSKLNLWELKYSIYNDKNKYNWADENGKGVVYWLKDEFNNEAGYDFKSALFEKCVQKNILNYKERPYIEECSQYITFNKAGSEETDLSLVGDFTNCKIDFLKKLPFIKLTYKGSNINISGSSAYIYNGIGITLEGSVNYIETSQDLNLKTSYTTVLNSYDIVTKSDNLSNYINLCMYISLGFNNLANYLTNCQYIITNSGVSKLDVDLWYFCKIDSDVYNLISKDIELEYSTIGYNNLNVTFKGSGTFKNKTISPSTFTTSWQDPNYEFEFNSEIADEYETISKKQFVTYID